MGGWWCITKLLFESASGAYLNNWPEGIVFSRRGIFVMLQQSEVVYRGVVAATGQRSKQFITRRALVVPSQGVASWGEHAPSSGQSEIQQRRHESILF